MKPSALAELYRLRAERAETTLETISDVCGMAGVGSRGQSVLCRVRELHSTLGAQIERAERAESEVERLEAEAKRLNALLESRPTQHSYDVIEGENERLEAEVDALKRAANSWGALDL